MAAILRSMMLVVSVVVLSACFSATKLNSQNSLVESDKQLAHAKVYFIRPNTEHPQGFADNPLEVFLGEEKLLDLTKGEYTLVALKPQQVQITLKNLTQTRGRSELEEMERSRSFDFEADQTYYIVTQPTDGEFRGVHFIPLAKTEFEVRDIVAQLRQVGEAKKLPIQ